MTRISFILPFVLILTTACEPGVAKIGEPTDTGLPVTDVIDVTSTTNTTVDTDTTDSGDTADTGTLPDPCLRDVTLHDGTVIQMLNSVQIYLSGNSPSGSGFVPGYQETLRFDIVVIDADCPAIEILGINTHISASDNDSNRWWENIPYGQIAIYNLSVDGLTDINMDLVSATHPTSNEVLSVFNNGTSTIEGGETNTFAFYADTTSASTVNDDSIVTTIPANSLVVSDGVTTVTLQHNEVTGGTMVF